MPTIRAFTNFIQEVIKRELDPLALIEGWANFKSSFVRVSKGRSFFMYWVDAILTDENEFTLEAERGTFSGNSVLASLTRSDLKRLSIISEFDVPMLALHLSDVLWGAGYQDCAKLIEEGVLSLGALREANESLPHESYPYILMQTHDINEFAAEIRKNGAGLFSRYNFFQWLSIETQSKFSFLINKFDRVSPGPFSPALTPDTITLDDLSGYEEQRKIVIDNTLRLIEGKGEANNILLYGDRGTGKSATVKAICNSFADRGLRLVELLKRDMEELPAVLKTLSLRGLYFVLFIDDLSFESQSDSFNMLKAMLEGGIEAKPDNVVIYATSNRRHLVKEKSQDRPDSAAAAASIETGDMRAFDTMQEQLSLSDRFGITVVFTSPSQDDYLNIAEFLAKQRGVLKDDSSADERAVFRNNALKWERWFNGRSPRTARQYVNWLASGDGFPWESK